MATLLRRIYYGYRYINEELSGIALELCIDPRTQDFFLIGSPWATLAIVTFYLYFVRTLGPRMMANRKPFNLDRVMQIYNLIQIISCSYVFYKALTLAWLKGYKLSCEPVDYSWTPRAIEIAGIVWIYFILKLLDLLDTVFFVLRKKHNQVSFLHVYHHTGMAIGSWAATKFLAGGHISFLGTVNSFVHIVMYMHYLATSLRINTLRWKKYVTQLQIIQFVLLLFHFILLVWAEDCGFPKWTAAVLIPQNLFMLMLFTDFYYKAYVKVKKSPVNGVSMETSNGKPKGQ